MDSATHPDAGPLPLPARPAEQLLINAVPDRQVARVLCTSLGRAQLASELARRFPAAGVCCHFLDLHQAELARSAVAAADAPVSIVCEADFPPEEFDLVCLPFSFHGEAELAREWMQTGCERLALSGQMIVATDNPDDTWLHREMKKLFRKVTRNTEARGAVYLATKLEPLRRHRNFTCEFAFRDRERLIHVVSRPGVFSHRRLDLGARALIESLAVRPGDRVLEFGCGAGAVSFAAALRAADVRVTALDANPRAIECTRRGALRNELPDLVTVLSADGQSVAPGSYDLVVANPPYYSQFRIGDLFVRGAERALHAGGVLHIVTRQHEAYRTRMASAFQDVTVHPVRDYWIVRGTRRITE